MEEAANLISSLQQTLIEVDTVIANVNERSKRTILHIETAAQRLVQTITENKHKLVSKVCAITEAKLQALQAGKECVQDNFRAVENVLRCAQNTSVVEDCEEWEGALLRRLRDLKEQLSFNFQEYNEDMKFHFLYRDEELLATICKFGKVFTIANDDKPRKLNGCEAGVLQPKKELGIIDFSNEIVVTGIVDPEPLLMVFQEYLRSPGQNTATESSFVGESLHDEYPGKLDNLETGVLQRDKDVLEDNVEEDIVVTDIVERDAFLIKFQENVKSPDQNTATQSSSSGGFAQVFEEMVDVTRLKREETKECQELSREHAVLSLKRKLQTEEGVIDS